jgi:uncharacterized membrane protein
LFFLFLMAGGINIALGGGLLFRKLSGFLIATIPLLVIIGLVRAVALLRRSTQASWRDALGAFVIWQSTSLVTARASVQALYAKEAEFLRTPKTAEDASVWDAVRGNRGETMLAALGVAGIVLSLLHPSGYAGPLTAALLIWPTLAYLMAPLNSLAAQRAALPADLRERRRTEFLRSGNAKALTAAAGGLAFAGVAVAAVLALIAPGNVHVNSPSIIGPVRGTPAPKSTPNNAPTPGASTSSPGATSSPSAQPSTSPSPSPSATTSPSATSTPTPSATSKSPSPSPSPTPSPTRTSTSPTPSPSAS